MFVKPTEGRKVRRPDTYALLNAEGEEVPRDEFWLRRLRDRDVEPATPKALPAATAPAAPAEDPVPTPPAVTAPAAPHAS